MKINYQILSTGNLTGRYKKYFIFIFRRPGRFWCSQIKLNKKIIALEGYFGASLGKEKTEMAKRWVMKKLKEYEVTES